MDNFNEFNENNNQKPPYEVIPPTMSTSELKGLKFEGSALGYVGYSILISIGTALSFGLLYPFLMSRLVRWCVQNTTYNGKHLRFVGSSVDLYTKIIICGLIGIFTFGIGFLFYGYYFVKWIIENTVVE